LSKFQGDPCHHHGCVDRLEDGNRPGDRHRCICLAVLGRKLKQQVGVKLAESQGRSLKSQSSFRFLACPRGRDEDLVWKKVDTDKTVQI